MNILEFNKQFPDEQSCKDYLSQLRLSRGIICKECNSVTKHWYLKSVEKFKCSICGSRTTLKSGTLMEQSNLPLQVWFMTIHLMTSIKKSFSCLELQRQLGFNRYETIQNLMWKIRSNMGQREMKYKLSGQIELDHGMFEVVTQPVRDEQGEIVKESLKSGLGSQRQLPVLVMCESRERPQMKGYKVNRELGYVKMIVMDDLKSDGVNYEIEKHVSGDSHIISDNSKSYTKIKKVVEKHSPETMSGRDGVKKLPWVHTVISNSKKQLLGVHHSIRGEYLQTYLDEFCYKLNRRNFETDMFDRMLVSGLVKNERDLSNKVDILEGLEVVKKEEKKEKSMVRLPKELRKQRRENYLKNLLGPEK
jgi:hypothetical protein